jgi:cobalt-zinc-cadmium resistance protein CzcA
MCRLIWSRSLQRPKDWIIKPQLQTIPGVTEVLGIGGFEKQYQVVIRPEALVQ